MNDTEKYLIERLIAGDEEAFREFVDQYKKRAFYLALDLLGNEFDAEDVSQEAFMKVFTQIHTFRGDAKLSTWFYRIVINCAINKTRRKSYSSEFTYGDKNPDDIVSSGSTDFTHNNPENAVESKLLDYGIQQALNKLTENQRTIFVLRHYQDLPLQEISQIMKCSVGTVKSQLFRSTQKLQKLLSSYRKELSAA